MGWARANMLYDRMSSTPDPGSPMEILFLVLWRMRQQTEFQKSRSIVQALLSQQGAEGKAIEKAFEDLRESFFPFDARQRTAEIAELKKVMAKELARGPMRVTPMVDLTRVKLKQRLHQGQEEMTKKAELLKSGKLRTLGSTSLETAKRRDRSHAVSLTSRGSVKTLAQPTNRRGSRSPA